MKGSGTGSGETGAESSIGMQSFPTAWRETGADLHGRGDRLADLSLNGYENRYLLFLEDLAGRNCIRVISACSLLFALTAWPLLILIDIPDDPINQIVDIAMIVCMLIFGIEIVLDSVREPRIYFKSFFFWADTAGTLSVIFDINFMLGTEGELMSVRRDVNTPLLRMARIAKLGARAGRLLKVMKIITLFWKQDQGRGKLTRQRTGTRNIENISKKLTAALSAKVAFLALLFVLVVPLFSLGQYPEEDLSMSMSCERLEEAYEQAIEKALASATDTSLFFSAAVQKMRAFYDLVDYTPERVSGFASVVDTDSRQVFIPGADDLPDELPNRKASIFRAEVSTCLIQRSACSGDDRPYVDFNFIKPRRHEAALYMALLVFLLLAMGAVSCDLKNSVDQIILRPLSRMLWKVNHLATNIIEKAGQRNGQREDRFDKEASMATNATKGTASWAGGLSLKSLSSKDKKQHHAYDTLETDILEAVVEKLANLVDHLYKMQELQKELVNMDETSRGVVVDMLQVQDKAQEKKEREEQRDQFTLNGSTHVEPYDLGVRCVRHSMAERLSNVRAWTLNVLDLEPQELDETIMFLFFESELQHTAGRAWINAETFRSFLSKVGQFYYQNPYHNFYHAVDVTQTLYTMMHVTESDTWLSKVQTYAVMVAAVCHDMAHPGVNNQYLVETKHPLALLHNDKSPLENMHCSRLFDLSSFEDSDVFKNMSRIEFKEARKVCIETILHTDYAFHMDMVKETSTIYESQSVVCDDQSANSPLLTSTFVDEVLKENTMLWLNLFVHLSDVSNPCKPFCICQAWAWRVLDEFFAQGDMEKELHIPVGMLNDRDKINRPGSQHGFIVFMVAPLVVNAVKLFHPLYPLHAQMAGNLQEWEEFWEKDAKPAAADIEKRNAEVDRVEQTSKDLAGRCPNTPEFKIMPWDGIVRVAKPVAQKQHDQKKILAV